MGIAWNVKMKRKSVSNTGPIIHLAEIDFLKHLLYKNSSLFLTKDLVDYVIDKIENFNLL